MVLMTALPAMGQTVQNQITVECPTDIPGCRCYNKQERDKLATAIVDLQKCQLALDEKERLIEKRFITFDAQHGIAWWQEPTVVFSGMVISASVASIITVLATN